MALAITNAGEIVGWSQKRLPMAVSTRSCFVTDQWRVSGPRVSTMESSM